MGRKVSKKSAITAMAIAALSAGAIGGTWAYFTDAEVANNVITNGNVLIESTELNYPGNDSPEVKDITPNREIAKDPMITNTGVNDAIVYMTIDSPMEKITVIKDNGEVETAKGIHEMFWFKDANDAASTHANNFDAKWAELTSRELYVLMNDDGTDIRKVESADLESAYAETVGTTKHLVKRYVFAYKTKLEGSTANDGSAQTVENKKTSNLFDKVQMKNVLEGETNGAAEKIRVRSFAIQASNILENNADLVTDPLTTANLEKIYDIFVRQNSTGDDATGLKLEGIRDADSVQTTDNGADGTTTNHVNRWNTADQVGAADDTTSGKSNIKPGD